MYHILRRCGERFEEAPGGVEDESGDLDWETWLNSFVWFDEGAEIDDGSHGLTNLGNPPSRSAPTLPTLLIVAAIESR
jgi:hypothetical protein